MPNSMHLQRRYEGEAVSPRYVRMPGTRPIDADQWRQSGWSASSVRAANGFNAVPSADVASSPMSFALWQAARANRSKVLGEVVAVMVDAIGRFARRIYASRRRRPFRWATGVELSQLNDRTLRDLGFYRSGILSVAADIPATPERAGALGRPTPLTRPWFEE